MPVLWFVTQILLFSVCIEKIFNKPTAVILRMLFWQIVFWQQQQGKCWSCLVWWILAVYCVLLKVFISWKSVSRKGWSYDGESRVVGTCFIAGDWGIPGKTFIREKTQRNEQNKSSHQKLQANEKKPKKPRKRCYECGNVHRGWGIGSTREASKSCFTVEFLFLYSEGSSSGLSNLLPHMWQQYQGAKLPGFAAVCNHWMSGSHLCFVRKQKDALQAINLCLSPTSGYLAYFFSSSASYWHCIDRGVGKL